MKQITVILSIVSLLSCTKDNNEIIHSWEDLSLPVQTGYVLFIDNNNLYVGAGYDGLWARNLSRRNSKWEYLGHRVTEGERHFEAGVQAINVYNGTITIGYICPPEIDDGKFIGVWRSKDRGNTWEPADEGIRLPWGTSKWSSARSIVRSPYNSDHVLLGYGDIFKSKDGGNFWYRVYPEPDFPYRYSSLYFSLIWHPTNPNIIWAHGETNRFQPWLMRSVDAGNTWEEYFHVNVPRDNAFYSMAFDADDPDIIYIGAQGAVIRSTKGGEEWMGEEPVPALFTDDQGNYFYALQTHPEIPGVLFAGAGKRLYGSKDYGETVSILETPDKLTFIIDMWYDEDADILYASGDGGVFRIQNPVRLIPY